MTNLYQDPGLESDDYAASGSAIIKDGNSIVFSGAGSFDALALEGDAEAAFFAHIAKSGQYQVSVNVADYEQGSAKGRLRAGTMVDLGISGDGWSTPVTITAGTNEFVSFVLYGLSGGTFRIVPDPDEESEFFGQAIRITT